MRDVFWVAEELKSRGGFLNLKPISFVVKNETWLCCISGTGASYGFAVEDPIATARRLARLWMRARPWQNVSLSVAKGLN